MSRILRNGKLEDAAANRIVRGAGKAFAVARRDALMSGHFVYVVRNGRLLRIEPSGEYVVVKDVVYTQPKSTITLKKGVPTPVKWKKSLG